MPLKIDGHINSMKQDFQYLTKQWLFDDRKIFN